MASNTIKMVFPEKRITIPWAWCPECMVRTDRDKITGECLQCKKKKEQNIRLKN